MNKTIAQIEARIAELELDRFEVKTKCKELFFAGDKLAAETYRQEAQAIMETINGWEDLLIKQYAKQNKAA